MKSRLQDNDIEMYSTHKEEKFVVAERFIRTLKKNIYKHMTSLVYNLGVLGHSSHLGHFWTWGY